MPNWFEWPTSSSQDVRNLTDSRCRASPPPDDTNIPFAAVIKGLQRLLVGGTIVGGDRLFDAVELRHRRALSNPLLTHLMETIAGHATIFPYAASAAGSETER